MILVRCVSAVLTLIWRKVATSLVVFPSAINWRTCRSLGLRGSGRSSVFPANLTNFLSTCCALARSTRFPFTSTASPPAPLAIGKAPSASVESIQPRPPQPFTVGRPKGRRRKNRRQSHNFFKHRRSGLAPQLAATPWGGSPPRPLRQKICYQTAQKTALCAPASTQEASESENRPATRGTAHSEVQGDVRGTARSNTLAMPPVTA